MNNITGAIKHLIIINVILFVGPQFMKLDFSNLLALHFPKNEHFGIWQYITHMFMHGSFGGGEFGVSKKPVGPYKKPPQMPIFATHAMFTTWVPAGGGRCKWSL